MPSLLSLFHPKNPYTRRTHPQNHIPSTTTTPLTTSHPRPASPREALDYLAEARAASGRDAVTGRPLNNNAGGGSRRPEGDGRENASGGVETSKYELFVQAMKARRDGREGVLGYYAPAAREAREYYAPVVVQGRR